MRCVTIVGVSIGWISDRFLLLVLPSRRVCGSRYEYPCSFAVWSSPCLLIHSWWLCVWMNCSRKCLNFPGKQYNYDDWFSIVAKKERTLTNIKKKLDVYTWVSTYVLNTTHIDADIEVLSFEKYLGPWHVSCSHWCSTWTYIWCHTSNYSYSLSLNRCIFVCVRENSTFWC